MILAAGLALILGTNDPPPAPLELSHLATSRGVFHAALIRLEGVERGQRTAELCRFLDDAHAALLEGSPDRPALRQRRTLLLLGLGALFDPGDVLLAHPLSRPLFKGIVEPDERIRRLLVCESVLFEDRTDAAKHFFVSAALAAVAGPFLGERIGRNKEFQDARRYPEERLLGQGFSFVDLAYNHAGIRYAGWILGDKHPERLFQRPPPLERFVPSFAPLELPEGLDWDAFRRRYQGANSKEYWKVIRRIHTHLEAALGNPSETPKKKR